MTAWCTPPLKLLLLLLLLLALALAANLMVEAAPTAEAAATPPAGW